MVERGLGIACEKPTYADLDRLAGSWTAADEKAFEENTQYFEKIDMVAFSALMTTTSRRLKGSFRE